MASKKKLFNFKNGYAMFFLLSMITACLARPNVVKIDNNHFRHLNQKIKYNILKVAKTGDWLVIRGYHATDDLVAHATGIPISHAGVLDLQNQTVIEAEGNGVHSTKLDQFVDKSFRLLVIRPRWRTQKNAKFALSEARQLIGKKYDYLGTIGFSHPDKYYCSELVIYIYKKWFKKKEKFPAIIKPGELYLFGQILYDSLPRDEM